MLLLILPPFLFSLVWREIFKNITTSSYPRTVESKSIGLTSLNVVKKLTENFDTAQSSVYEPTGRWTNSCDLKEASPKKHKFQFRSPALFLFSSGTIAS